MTGNSSLISRRLKTAFDKAAEETSPDRMIHTLLQETGEAFGCERVFLLEENENGKLNETYEWCASGIISEKDLQQGLNARDCYALYDSIGNEEGVEIQDIEDIKKTAPEYYALLVKWSVHSLYFHYLRREGRRTGFVGVANPASVNGSDLLNALELISIELKQMFSLRSLVERLERAGYRDRLTGLGSRNALYDSVEGGKKAKSLGILYADVTGLKAANDTYGHDAGDSLLIHTASLLARICGSENCFRVGGDEFMVLCRNLSRHTFLVQEEAVRNAFEEAGMSLAVGSIFEEPWETDFDILVKRADLRMYDDKRAWYLRTAGQSIQKQSDVTAVLELNLNQGTYRVLYRSQNDLFRAADQGNMKDFENAMGSRRINPHDLELFQNFYDSENLRKRLLEQNPANGDLKLEFRMLDREGSWNWVRNTLLVLNPEEKNFSVLLVVRNLSLRAEQVRNMFRGNSYYGTPGNAVIHLYHGEETIRRAAVWFARSTDPRAAVIVFDIDHFKLYNSIFGRSAGDRVLELFGETLLKYVQTNGGIAGYLGGDNFLMVIPADFSQDILKQKLKNYIASLDIPAGFTPSCGVCICADHSASFAELYDHAMLAQSRIRNSQLENVAFYDEKEFERLRDEQLLLIDIERALQDDEITFYLQPKVNMSNGKIIASEALVRWNHEGHIIPPSSFIEVLERNDAIHPLDLSVWTQVAAFQKMLLEEGIRPLPISVNVSQKDIIAADVAAEFEGLLKKYDLDPDLIHIEITESAYAKSEEVRNTVRRLHEDGFEILLDDFGKGYSSLTSLHGMHVDVIKIDKRFVDPIAVDPDDREIVSTVIHMAHMIGMKIVVEGVEEKDQAEILLDLNCRYAQGYLYYRPMPYLSYARLLEDSSRLQFEQPIPARKEIHSFDLSEMIAEKIITPEILEEISGPIGLWERIGDHLYLRQVNHAYGKLLGVEVDEDVSMKTFMNSIEAGEEAAIQKFDEARKKGKASFTSRYTRPDGYQLQFTVMIYPLSTSLNGDLYMLQVRAVPEKEQ